MAMGGGHIGHEAPLICQVFSCKLWKDSTLNINYCSASSSLQCVYSECRHCDDDEFSKHSVALPVPSFKKEIWYVLISDAHVLFFLKLCLLLELCIRFSLFFHVFPEAVCFVDRFLFPGLLLHNLLDIFKSVTKQVKGSGKCLYGCFSTIFLINWKWKKERFEESSSLSKIFIAYRLLITSVLSLLQQLNTFKCHLNKVMGSPLLLALLQNRKLIRRCNKSRIICHDWMLQSGL